METMPDSDGLEILATLTIFLNSHLCSKKLQDEETRAAAMFYMIGIFQGNKNKTDSLEDTVL